MLVGVNTVLRPPGEEDAPFFTALRNDVTMQLSLMALPRANSEQRVRDWIDKILNDPGAVFFTIADAAEGRALGYIQLTEMDFIHGIGRLGICLVEAAHGKGYATEALRLLETYVREVFNLRKIILHVLASNQRAIAFYRKSGYDLVGVHKEHIYQRESYEDVLILEKLLPTLTTRQTL